MLILPPVRTKKAHAAGCLALPTGPRLRERTSGRILLDWVAGFGGIHVHRCSEGDPLAESAAPGRRRSLQATVPPAVSLLLVVAAAARLEALPRRGVLA